MQKGLSKVVSKKFMYAALANEKWTYVRYFAPEVKSIGLGFFYLQAIIVVNPLRLQQQIIFMVKQKIN